MSSDLITEVADRYGRISDKILVSGIRNALLSCEKDCSMLDRAKDIISICDILELVAESRVIHFTDDIRRYLGVELRNSFKWWAEEQIKESQNVPKEEERVWRRVFDRLLYMMLIVMGNRRELADEFLLTISLLLEWTDNEHVDPWYSGYVLKKLVMENGHFEKTGALRCIIGDKKKAYILGMDVEDIIDRWCDDKEVVSGTREVLISLTTLRYLFNEILNL